MHTWQLLHALPSAAVPDAALPYRAVGNVANRPQTPFLDVAGTSPALRNIAMIDFNARHRGRQCIARNLAWLGLMAAAIDTQAAIFTVGASGTGCTHTTIQAAVTAAESSAGADSIRITRSLAYTAQQVVVNTVQDLNIVGGFADCSASVSDGQQTVISGADSVLALEESQF